NSGTGLGLYLSRQIVEAHQGNIWVESEEGKGSRFSLILPIRTEPSTAKTPASSATGTQK
nr:HAMP domain-containing histidine kinase [Vampirovibrio sp.]